jgi:hypothetical protein
MLSEVRCSVHSNRSRVMRTLVLCGVLGLALAPSAPAQEPNTLAGELFVCTSLVDVNRCDPGDRPTFTQVECDAPFGRVSFHYQAEGLAGGPYPGTFTEEGHAAGTLEATRDPFSVGPPDEFEASFTIRDVAGNVTVTGRKRLVDEGTLPLTFVGCIEGETRTPVIFVAAEPGPVCYTARFVGTGEIERGFSQLNVQDQADAPPGFVEGFFPDPTIESCGFVPVSKEECTGDPGYEFFGFKNRGDCVSFVASEGKNEPGKNQKK